MGTTTLFSGNCEISNPTLSCALESPESLETTGIAGRCDPEVGSIATHLTFSRLLFDLAHTRPKTCDSEAFPNWPNTARAMARPSAFPTQPHKPRHRATQGPTGGNE